MAKQKPLIKIDYPIYKMQDWERFMAACRALDCTGEELLKFALDIYLSEHGF